MSCQNATEQLKVKIEIKLKLVGLHVFIQ